MNIEITPGTRDGRFEEPHSDPTTASNFEMLIYMVEESGFEPLKAELTDLQSVPFGQLGNSSECAFALELMGGLEPLTY